MPELPEVEIVRRALEPVMVSGELESLKFNRPNLRFDLPQNLPALLEGQRIKTVSRRGKYILVFAENGYGFVLHLGMSGIIRIEPQGAEHAHEKHDHVEINMKDGARIILNDARRFGFLEKLHEKNWRDYSSFAAMGPEPLGNELSAPVLFAALSSRKSPIKNTLLDQRVVAGLGNIYVCEALFYAGIDPKMRACDIDEARCEILVREIKRVLNAALKSGGSSLKDYKHTDGKLGYFQHHFAVYDREGASCRGAQCEGDEERIITRIVQSGRSTFFCPHCQG